jgi:hypothetical protein
MAVALPRLRALLPNRANAAIMLLVATLAILTEVAWASSKADPDLPAVTNLSLAELDEQLQVSPPHHNLLLSLLGRN